MTSTLNLSTGVGAAAGSVFRVGHITEPSTATRVMQLVDVLPGTTE